MYYKILTALLLCALSNYLIAQPINDDFLSATDITAIINGSSASAAYTTAAATGDNLSGSTWNTTGGTPSYNVWFKVQAPATGMLSVIVDRGGTQGNIQRINAAIWQADGTTEVTSNRYQSSRYEDVTVDGLGLTPGAWYYISVDNAATSVGSFSLTLSDQLSYDYYEGAIDVTAFINGSSASAAYTTVQGTTDRNTGSAWNTAGGTTSYNKWFKVLAPATGMLSVIVDRGGAQGNIQRINAAIWEADGTTEVSSNRYQSSRYEDVTVDGLGLTPGAWYYISVDNAATSVGSFSLTLSDQLSYDYYEGAIDVTAFINGSSASAAYTTVQGTTDRNTGSAWNTAGGTTSYNKWFKVLAPATGMLSVIVDRGGAQGNIQRINAAIWEADGTTEVSSNRYQSSRYEDVTVDGLGLTPGAWYYISVDNAATSVGTFSLTLSDQVSYDYYEGAIDVTAFINGSSPASAYTTVQATTDKVVGSVWNTAGGTPSYNRWFKVQATATGMLSVIVDRGGAQGNIQRINAAIWEADGTTEVSSNRYQTSRYEDVTVDGLGLTPGAWYYISVDNASTSVGTFSLTLSDQVSYDYYEGAIDVTSFIGGSSPDAAYTTVQATTDKVVGSAWNTAGGTTSYNRWFTFQASASGAMDVTVNRGGAKGTIQRINVAVWEANGTTEIISGRYGASRYDDVTVTAVGLVPGNWYYISVDNASTSVGTFTLELDDNVVLTAELLHFDAHLIKGQVHLEWVTANEINTDYFSIERSEDNVHFVEVIYTKAAGNSIGESYDEIDMKPHYGVMYYRINQYDKDGSNTISKSVMVDYKSDLSFNIYPNPSSDGNVFIRFTGLEDHHDEVLVVLKDVYGHEVYSKVEFTNGQSDYLSAIDHTHSLAAGVYYVTGSTDNRVFHKTLIIQ